jgi:hypothetical protein
MPINRPVQLMLGDGPSRQAVIPMPAPMPPQKVSIRRRNGGISPNPAVTAVELHNGEIRACRHRSREAERQHADGENKLFHSQTPRVAPSAAGADVCRRLQKAMSYQTSDAHLRCHIARVPMPQSSSAGTTRWYCHPACHGVALVSTSSLVRPHEVPIDGTRI